MCCCRGARRHVSAERAVRAGRSLEPSAAARCRRQIIGRDCNLFVIDAYSVAREAGMGSRINTIMQTCFFAISGVLPREEAIAAIKHVDREHLWQARQSRGAEEFRRCRSHSGAVCTKFAFPRRRPASFDVLPPVAASRTRFRAQRAGRDDCRQGDALPVSAHARSTARFPTGTLKWEKRNIAQEIPVWDEDLCIQCGKCVLVCPHAVIRAKVYDSYAARRRSRGVQIRQTEVGASSIRLRYPLQVSPEDCTGCKLCVEICPVKSKSEAKHKAINMAPQAPLRDTESANWEFFLPLPELDRDRSDARSRQGRPAP